MAKARSITFNISTTADFGQLEGLRRAINDVSTAVEGLAGHMRSFNNNFKGIKSNYDKATASVKQFQSATVKMTASIDNAAKAQTRYQQVSRQQVALGRQLKSQNDALVRSRENLVNAERDLKKAQSGGDQRDIERALQVHKEAKAAFDAEVKSAAKLGNEYEKLDTERRNLGNTITNQKGAIQGWYSSLSKEAQAGAAGVKGIVTSLTDVSTKLKGTMGTWTKYGDIVKENTRLSKDTGGDKIVQDAKRTAQVLEQSARGQIEASKMIAQQEKVAEEQRIAQIRATRLAREQSDDATMASMRQRMRAESEMWDDAIRMNKEYDQVTKKSAQDQANAQKQAAQAMQLQQQAIQNVQNKIKSMASLAASAFKSFANAAAGTFQRFGGMLMTAQNAVTRFSKAVSNAMTTAQRAMTNFYNSGWSFITSGYIFQNFGQQLARTLGMGLQEYTTYEQDLTRAAIAGQDERGQINSKNIQDLVFGLQRGTIGGTPLKQFSADDIAKAAYYYSSAIGQPITPETQGQVGGMLSDILQLASASMTDVETATKGILNIAMEFGVSPQKAIQEPTSKEAQIMDKLPSQIAYLANLTTQEVPDILEMFKMVGPMAHILTDRTGPGAGLDEIMALSVFTSNLGLRGSRVGSGVNQALTTLLDPSDKSIDMAAAAWGDKFGEATKDNWNKFFFDDDGTLEGGIKGFLKKFEDIAPKDQARILAELFTTNATRNLVAIQQALQDHPIEEVIAQLNSPEATGFLTNAFEATSKTIFASIQNMMNAIFQFKTAVIDGVKEPLIAVFDTVAAAFFKLATIVENNPWIGTVLAGIIAVTAAVSTLIGTLFMAGGSILLMLKAFTVLGGMFGPMVLLLSAFTTGLLVIIPLIAAIGAAILYLSNQWKDADSVFHQTVVMWGERFHDVFSNIGETAPDTFSRIAGIVNAFVNNTGDRIVAWAYKNRDAFIDLKEAVMEFLTAFGTGALTSFIAAIMSFAHVLGIVRDTFNEVVDAMFHGQQVFDISTQRVVEMESSFENLVESLIGVETESISLAKVVGGVLGAAFGLLVARHFIPSIATTILLRGSFIALRVVMLALAAASFVVSGAFTVLQATFTVIGALIGVLGTMWGALTTITDLNTVSTAANSVASGILSAAFGIQAAAASTLTIVLGLLAVAYLAVMAAIAVIIVGIIAYTTATQGLSAGLESAKQAALGVAEGFWMVMEPIVKLVAGIVMLIGSLLEFVSVSTDVHTLGVILGVMLAGLAVTVVALTAAIAALGVVIATVVVVAILQWIAALIAANLPLLAIVAVVTLILGLLSEFLGFDGVFDMLGAGFGHVAHAAEVAYNAIKRVAGGIKDMFTTTKEESKLAEISVLEAQRQDIMGQYTKQAYPRYEQIQQEAFSGGAFSDQELEKWYQSSGAASRAEFFNQHSYDDWMNYAVQQFTGGYSPTENIDQQIAMRRSELAAMRMPEDVTHPELQTDVNVGTFSSDKTKKGLMDRINGFFESFGFDVHDPVGSLTKMMGLGTLDEFTAGAQNLDLSAFGTSPEMAKYMQDTADYGEYLQRVAEVSKQISASRAAAGMGALDPKTLEEVAKSQVQMEYNMRGMAIPVQPVLPDTAIAGVQNQLDKTDFEIQLTAAIAKGADLPTTLGLAYGKNSAASGILQYSDQIMSALGDSAPWMNPTELLADAAISGDLSTGLAGKNIQKELEPFLRVTAEQTGVSISDMIKDIPRFVAPDALVNVATTELIQGLDTMPEEIGKRLDLLGTDVQDRWGNFVAENGFNWSELATYAASQGTNQDWNLIDYATQAWDMTTEQAEAYFKSHGVDPNIINGALFGDTRMMANMMDGAVAVVDDGFYKWAQTVDSNQDKILEITQAGFDALPLAVKIGLSNMGYSFVIGGEEVAGQIDATTRMLGERVMNTYKIFDTSGAEVSEKVSKAFWDSIFADMADDGIINGAWAANYIDENGNQVLTDAAGNTIVIPPAEIKGAAEYDAQMDQLEADLDRWRKRRERLKQEIADLTTDIGVLQEDDKKGPWRAGFMYGGTSADNDKQILNIQAKIDTDQASLDRTRTAINNALGIAGAGDEPKTMTIDSVEISVSGTEGFTTAVKEMVKTGVSTGMQEITLDATILDTTFSAIGTSAAAAFSTAFSNAMAVSALYNQGGSQSSDGQIYGDAGTTRQQATAPTQTITTKYALDTTDFDAKYAAVMMKLSDSTHLTYLTNIDLNHVNFDTELAGVNTALDTYNARVDNATVGIDSVQMYGELYGVNAALDTYDSRVVNATVGIVDYASTALQNIINKMNELNGKVSTTYTQHVDLQSNTGPQRQAIGGVTREPLQIVGERGPELAAMPMGTRVQSSGRTMRMLQEALSPKDNNVELASLFRQAAQDTAGGDTVNSGNTTVVIQNLNITNDQDGQRFFEQMDRWQGRRNQLANRGMIPTDNASTI